MSKHILFVAVIFMAFSCNQNTKITETNKAANGSDSNTLQDKKPTEPDIDGLTASPANFKLLLENEHVRVLEYTLKPGEKDQWHTHPAKSSYVVSGGQLTVHLENGDTILADEKAGTVSWMDHVGKHYVENTGNTTVKIILTEIKSLEK